jgi:hypothetical protein
MTKAALGVYGAAVAGLALWLAPVAQAKEFKPGDIRICAAKQCLPLNDRDALNALSAFYYSSKQIPRPKAAPASTARYVELRFPNGYVTGIAAGHRYDHFLSYGVNLGQFKARTWYAIPARASVAIKALATRLRTRPLPTNVLSNSH